MITVVIPSVIRLSLLATVESIVIQGMPTDIRVVFGDNVSNQRNEGFEGVKSRYILFTDDDVVLQRDCLKNLVEVIEGDKLDVVFASIKGSFNNSPEHPFSGAGIFCKTEVLQNIKFDENLKVSEDIDFGWQLMESDYKWSYTEKAVIYHLRSVTKHKESDKLAKKWPERYKHLKERYSSVMR